VRGYPIYSAVVFGVIILLGGWQARAAPRRAGAALWVAVAAAVAFAAGDFFVAPRAQPSLRAVQPGVSVLYQVVSGFPPPSGVAAMAGAVAAGLFLVHSRAAAAATVAAAAVAVFQICVVAYAWQDVVAGIVFGIAIMGGGYAVLADPLARVAGPFARGWPARPFARGRPVRRAACGPGIRGHPDRERRDQPAPPA